MFRTQSKEIYESGAYQTQGMDLVATSERVILIDTQVNDLAKVCGSLMQYYDVY